ncbi:protoporphyrinogen oxidase [Paramicrobacterium fandaimingii]|uniref:protoporphyrinogen oxidase n=1 Tax=Paramicrobacterium fandaimingii TaxID=2708079 RepID=UPI001F1F4A1A|nr:protoporphyrinogen oxidase [Microbacterium fandaimingii]
MPSERHVIVVGGGIAGLVAAYECARIGVRVTVLEADDRVGGCVRTERIAGVDVDTGAESFATRGGAVRGLIDELGLTESVVEPSTAGAWLAFDDTAAPLPKAGILGIPSNPLADDVRRIIGWKGAIRAYADRVKPVLTIGTERNLGELVEKRMGVAVLENLVAPVTNGVYSADPSQLDVSRASPGLNNALTIAGSLSGAVASLRDTSPAGAAVGGFAGGMRVLVDALLDTLANYEVRVLTSTPVTAIENVGDEQWRVHAETSSQGESDVPETLTFESDAVIVATPEKAAARLLGDLVPTAFVEADVEPPTVDIVTLAVDNALLDEHPRGTGVLTAASARRTAKALTHSSAKWPWVEAALDTPHRHIVRVSFGRAGEKNPLDGLDDAQIADLARTEGSALLGVDIAPGDVVETLRTRWTSTLPRAFVGQTERASSIRDTMTSHPGLDVTGAWLSGTGLASVIPDAVAAAGRVRKRIVSEVLGGE